MTIIRDILLKALADRLAESFAEVLHAEVRNRLWGYADEHFSNEQLIREKYQRHPPGARLSGLPRPQPQADRCSTCSAASRAESR